MVLSKRQRGLQRPRKHHAVAWDYVKEEGYHYVCVLCLAKGETFVFKTDGGEANLPNVIGKHLVRRH